MDYKVEVHILDRGFMVESGEGRKDACQDGKELINCLGHIKASVEEENV